jgi:MFS family permease
MIKIGNYELNRKRIGIIFTIAIFVFMASLDNAVLGIFPPLNMAIAKEFGISATTISFITSGLNMFIIAVSSIFWGYLADKGKQRRNLMIIGTVIWSIGVFIIAFSSNSFMFIISQIITGLGLGCIATIGFSILTDFIPKNWRGMVMSLWGLSQGLGGIAGSVIASVATYKNNWRSPFEIIAILGLVFVVLYFFIKEPQRGATEPELKGITASGSNYEYKIEFNQIKELLSKPSNLWLILQSFFMNIVTGALVLLPMLYIAKLQAVGFDDETAKTASGYLFALLQFGGIASVYFGYLGDQLKRKSYRWRALMPAIALISAVPLYIAMFSMPFGSMKLPNSESKVDIFMGVINQIVTNPVIFAMFILAVFATMAQSVNTPNWMALITDVNLPEHRSTIFGIANLANGIARILGSAIFSFALLPLWKEPYNYIYAFSIYQIFFILAALCYIWQARSNGRDLRKVKSTLNRRARENAESNPN